MNRFVHNLRGFKALSLLLAAGFALCVPLTVFAQEVEPATGSQQPAGNPQDTPEQQAEFDTWVDAREQVRATLENTPQTYDAEAGEARKAQWQALQAACIEAYKTGATEVSLAAYPALTYNEIYAMLDNLRCLDGGENANAVYVLETEENSGIADILLIEYLNEDEKQAMQAAVNYYLGLANQGDNNFEKVLLLHDALALHCEYAKVATAMEDEGKIKPRSIYQPYGILVDSKGVCQSYAYAFQILMNKLGIPSTVVTSDKMNHAWNAVQLDGKWYHLDITWDDGGPDTIGYVSHDNFLKSTDQFETTHSADDYVGWVDLENVVAESTATTYDSMWWDDIEGGIFPLDEGGSNWCYVSLSGNVCTRSESQLFGNDSADYGFLMDYTSGEVHAMQQFKTIAVRQGTQNLELYGTDGTDIIAYTLSREEDGEDETVLKAQKVNNYALPNYGIACLNGTIYYAESAYPVYPASPPAPKPDYTDYIRSVKTLAGAPRVPSPILGTPVNEQTFPDEAFRNYLLRYVETDKNGYLSRFECEAVKKLELTGRGIEDLTGVALFTELEKLHCDNNKLTKLDLGQNAKLTTLICSNNELTALDLDTLPELSLLQCDHNHLAALDLTCNSALRTQEGAVCSIGEQTLTAYVIFIDNAWSTALYSQPNFYSDRGAAAPGPDGYPAYKEGVLILCGKDGDPTRPVLYRYATGAALAEAAWMEVTVTPIVLPNEEETDRMAAPTPAAPAQSPAPTPAPADNTHYIVCEACGYHDWVPYLEGYQCTHCGHLRGTTGVAATAAPAGTGATVATAKAAGGIPNTGDDSNPAAVVVVLLLSGFGVGCGVYKKKKTGR